MEKSIFEIMQQKQHKTSSGSIAYWVSKCQAKYTLVFLHGLTANHTLFERQISHFAGRCNLFCWDAPAHGKSRPFADFSYSLLAKNLRDILEKEQIKNVVLIGQSMGGFVAQTYMKQYPNEVKGFIGIDTSPFGLSYYSKADLWWLRQVKWMSMCFPHKLLVWSIAQSCTYTKAAYLNMLTALQPYPKGELCRLMGMGYAEFIKENCDLEITCPAVLLIGQHDRTGKVKQYCTEWHEKTKIPLHVIPHAAHNSNYDNSETVNQEIDRFLLTLIQ